MFKLVILDSHHLALDTYRSIIFCDQHLFCLSDQQTKTKRWNQSIGISVYNGRYMTIEKEIERWKTDPSVMFGRGKTNLPISPNIKVSICLKTPYRSGSTEENLQVLVSALISIFAISYLLLCLNIYFHFCLRFLNCQFTQVTKKHILALALINVQPQ